MRKRITTTRRRNSLISGICLTLILGLSACSDSKTVYEESYQTDQGEWSKDKIYSFTYIATDTMSAHNILFNVRHTGLYPRMNLYLFTSVESPGGGKISDTLEIMLADKRGKWLGKGWGDIWTRKVIYKHNVKFPKKGDYIFNIRHGERTDVLSEILDLGIEIEQIKK